MNVFDRIYRTNGWGGIESRSGPGSGSSATMRVAHELVALVSELGVTSVLDVGCGDGYWMPDLPNYHGIDVSSAAIELARHNHPTRDYAVVDIRSVIGWIVARRFGLVLVRDAIQHLPLVEGTAIIEGIGASRSRYLLASTFRDGENVDVVAGDAYSPDLTAPPFALGDPERLIFDGWSYTDGTLVRDPRKYLGLWRL